MAGGKGSRLSEETQITPKPLIEIGGKPLVQHIMDAFTSQGFSDFLLATGYKSNAFVSYFLDTGMGYRKEEEKIYFFDKEKEVTIVNTGLDTMTGGRIKRLESYLKEPFFLTYGDGLSNVSLLDVLDTNLRNQSLVTLTAVHPAGRFGSVYMEGKENVVSFGEKVDGQDWINGGFMVVRPEALSYICCDETNWEADCLPQIAKEGRMTAYRHEDFWHCIDTKRDLDNLEKIYNENGKLWLETT